MSTKKIQKRITNKKQRSLKMNQSQKIFVEYRKKTGLTQEEMANAFGVSQANISKIERGLLVPNADIVLRILEKQKKSR